MSQTSEVILKECSKCGVEQLNDAAHFPPKKHQCRECYRERARRSEEKKTALIIALKKDAKCRDCGYSGPSETIDFVYKKGEERYKSRKTKRTRNPSAMSHKLLRSERSKFEFLCTVCSRIETKKKQDELASNTPEAILQRRSRQEKLDVVNAEKLKRGGCKTCGILVNSNNFCAFDFDHLDPATKVKCVSDMACQIGCYSIQDIEIEMAKCQLLCARCHIIKSCEEMRQNLANAKSKDVRKIITRIETVTTTITTITSHSVESPSSRKRYRTLVSTIEAPNCKQSKQDRGELT